MPHWDDSLKIREQFELGKRFVIHAAQLLQGRIGQRQELRFFFRFQVGSHALQRGDQAFSGAVAVPEINGHELPFLIGKGVVHLDTPLLARLARSVLFFSVIDFLLKLSEPLLDGRTLIRGQRFLCLRRPLIFRAVVDDSVDHPEIVFHCHFSSLQIILGRLKFGDLRETNAVAVMICYHTILLKRNDVTDGKTVAAEIIRSLHVEDMKGVFGAFQVGMLVQRPGVDKIVMRSGGLQPTCLDRIKARKKSGPAAREICR